MAQSIISFVQISPAEGGYKPLFPKGLS